MLSLRATVLLAVGLIFSGCAHAGQPIPATPGTPAASSMATTAIVGATVIDGNGGKPLADATVLMQGRHILAVGARRKIAVPVSARLIEGRGLFVVPGFVDASVRLSHYQTGDTSTLAFTEDIAAAAHGSLRSGVTTLRDGYGVLMPLRAVRDSLRTGQVVGARLFIAGNVVGWGGPNSYTYDLETPFLKKNPQARAFEPVLSATEMALQASITQGVGEVLIKVDADSVRRLLEAYLDKGVDFVAYGGTTNADDIVKPEAGPNLILFTPRVQRTIVEVAHRRGLPVETHATSPEGLRMAVLAGVDLVQHPEAMAANYRYSRALVRLLVERHVLCAIRGARAIASKDSGARRNAETLIRAGCPIAVASDGQGGAATLSAIEALVDLGMTPMQALVAATKHGAIACKRLHEFGTVEAGKYADLVVLRADPLADIKNIRQIALVFSEGRMIDPDAPDVH